MGVLESEFEFERRINVPESNPARLLGTRAKVLVAIIITALALVLAIWRVVHFHAKTGWLLPLDFVLHGWPLIVVNVAFYAYLWWLAFVFIRGTAGAERVFVVGWFANILLSTVETVRPQWARPVKYLSMFALLASLLAAIALLLDTSSPSDGDQSVRV